ncbi:MAG: peptide chain release factor 2 [Patescibacteria group bacterium]|nr:peptide chain release factor 2 [Patescibacteria group bacterium]
MDELKKELEVLENSMSDTNFWADKDRAQGVIRRIQELKAEIAGEGKYDAGNALMTIFSGAGGDDAEDFSAILINMYLKFCEQHNFSVSMVHQNENDHGGYRNVTIEIVGKHAYGTLKNESGVHRLVRISPFNASQKRHTSFSMVEVIPEFEKITDFEIPEDELRVEFSRSSGPGGQNVNKRETAVRVVHIPTNIAAQSDNQRSQAQNKEKAMQILYGKLYKALEEDRVSQEKGMYVSKTTQIEWGSQIRSYVLHPYKMVKDHRTGAETGNVEKVLNGGLDEFIEAEKYLK